MTIHLTPVEVCERIVAPIEDLSRLCGLSPKAAYNWRRPSATRDAGDLTARQQRRILKHCEDRRIPMRPEWLIRGADAADLPAADAADLSDAAPLAVCPEAAE